MDPDDLLAEASAASLAFQAALVRIGAQTIEEALVLWRRLSATDAQGTAAAWLEDAVEMVMSRRSQSRELGIAFYRLTRALMTGSTVPDPNDPDPTYVTLGQLRTAFAELAESQLPDDAGDDLYVPVEPVETPTRPRDDAPGPTAPRDDEGVDLFDLTDDELRRALREDIARTERQRAEEDEDAEEELRVVLKALGEEGYLKRIQGLDDEAPASEVDAERSEAKAQAGARQAAAAERIALNAGRGEIFRDAEEDPRAIGYVRRSRTGTPCGWCAMLISRGLVLYRSKASATITADGDLYHDNCKCYAEPVYSTRQYDESDIYRLNRIYGEWWPKVTDGTSGKAAVALWRKFFRLTADMPEEQRIAHWERWLASADGREWQDRYLSRE
ncbi:VG15 protein [Puerhibacterium puerhi]|uniref:VG15 protein n=1 Tax=Puerhibacterium puerhi TaxID=2692623 RepID=UPI001915D3EA|nr:hypothetical protein [Puerhibacterium puerhi]